MLVDQLGGIQAEGGRSGLCEQGICGGAEGYGAAILQGEQRFGAARRDGGMGRQLFKSGR